jgi:hypothetical protein
MALRALLVRFPLGAYFVSAYGVSTLALIVLGPPLLASRPCLVRRRTPDPARRDPAGARSADVVYLAGVWTKLPGLWPGDRNRRRLLRGDWLDWLRALRKLAGLPPSTVETRLLNQWLATTEQALNPTDRQRVRREAALMQLEEALEYALCGMYSAEATAGSQRHDDLDPPLWASAGCCGVPVGRRQYGRRIGRQLSGEFRKSQALSK